MRKSPPALHNTHMCSDERIVEEYLRLSERQPNPYAAVASVLSIHTEQVKFTVSRAITSGLYERMLDKKRRFK